MNQLREYLANVGDAGALTEDQESRVPVQTVYQLDPFQELVAAFEEIH